MRRMLNTFIILVSLLNSSCATIFNGTSENIRINSEIPGTKIYLDNEYVGTRDATVRVSKKRNPIIRVKKEGCEDASLSIPRSFDGTSLLGLLLDLGIVSILVVDWAATGAIQNFDSTTFTLNPYCKK